MPCLTKTIRETHPESQVMLDEIAEATTLSLIIIAAWQLARILAIGLVEETLGNQSASKNRVGKMRAMWPTITEQRVSPSTNKKHDRHYQIDTLFRHLCLDTQGCKHFLA